MVIETDQNPGLKGWKKSGINVTKAEWWVYVYALDGGMTIVHVERLKRYLRLNKHLFNEETKRNFAEGSDNPAKGFILKPRHVMDMLINKKYDAIGGSNYGVFHLHRLDYNQLSAGGNDLTNRNLYRDDGANKG